MSDYTRTDENIDDLGPTIAAFNDTIDEAQKRFDRLVSLVSTLRAEFDLYAKALSDREIELARIRRTPEEIKRDIKHEKNPMRLKQLNRELNDSYKYWRKRE